MKVPSFGLSRIGKGTTTVITRRSLKGLKIFVGLFCVTAIMATGLMIPNAQAAAGINSAINFQGKLTNPNGTNITNGSYTFVFSLYSVASGGTTIWTETDSLSLTDGIFQVNLGPSAAGANTNFANVDFNSDSLYLGIKVGTDAEMSPRVQFTATPYSLIQVSLEVSLLLALLSSTRHLHNRVVSILAQIFRLGPRFRHHWLIRQLL